MTWRRFARDYAGNIVDIYNITNSFVKEHGNDSFKCIECNKPMRSRRGRKNIWHFSHVTGEKTICSNESYLHKLGIAKFIEEYKKRIENNSPFLLEIAQGEICHHLECPYGRRDLCRHIHGFKTLSLLHDFHNIEREIKDGDFIPDILLTANDGRKIYVEIVVKHFAEPRKITSGIPIIEIELKTEDDISLFSEDILSQRNESINMFNFDQYMVKTNFGCEKGLQVIKDLFIQNFRRRVNNKQALIMQFDYEILCNNASCPYIKDHLCIDYRSEEIDLIALYEETPTKEPSDAFSPDFFLTSKIDGTILRFNFCYELFSKAKPFEDVQTIQFALIDKDRTNPWFGDYICELDKEIRFFNISKHRQENLCEEKLRKFELIYQTHDDNIHFPGVAPIDHIYHYIPQISENLKDYILLPVFDGQKSWPCSAKEIKTIFEEKCNACLHCLDKRISGSKKRNLTCQLFNRPCENDEASECEYFKRNLKIQNNRSKSQKFRGLEWAIESWERLRLKGKEE